MLLSPLCFHSRSVRRSKNIPPNSSRLRRGYQAVFHGAPQLSGWCPNFLFDILGVHEKNYYVEISNELLDIINKHRLPFKLRYHQSTLREMRATITYLGSEIRTQARTQEYSRTAVFSSLSHSLKIDSEHHRSNGATPIDADSFLKRYEHLDILLKDKNVFVYRSQLERRRERAELLEKYQQFLSSRGRMKPYEAMDHDITVLDAVHQMRLKAKSSLEAGALFITCDNLLYMFDWETSQQQNQAASAVLPFPYLPTQMVPPTRTWTPTRV